MTTLGGIKGKNDKCDPTMAGRDLSSATRTHAHTDYVRATEKCLYDSGRGQDGEPNYLSELEREVLRDDPKIVAKIIETFPSMS